MTNDEAKFILSAYRPSGQDASEAAFAEAIDQAKRDPALGEWWRKSQAFDAAIAAGLRGVAPPAGLREAILAGGRLSQSPARRTFMRPGWFALAACLAALLVATMLLRRSGGTELERSYGNFALADIHEPGHLGDPDSSFNHWLSASAAPVDGGGMPVDWAQLEAAGCRGLSFGGRKVIEVCFRRGTTMYHLYILPRSPSDGQGPAQPVQVASDCGAAAVWSDARFIFAVATKAGTGALGRVLGERIAPNAL